MQPSVFRSAAVAVTGVIHKASSVLRADWPWQQVAYGRGSNPDDGRVVSTMTTLWPPASLSSISVSPTTVTPTTSTPTTPPASCSPSPSTTCTTERAITTTTLPVFTADKPLRLLVVGDSLMYPVGFAVMRQAAIYPALSVKTITKASSGLVRPDFYNWPKVITEAVAEYHPHVTVMMFGGNEKQVMQHQGRSLAPFSDEWNAEYVRRVGQVIDLSAQAGSAVIWVGMPIMRSGKFSQTVRRLNTFYSAACAERPAAVYIDGYALFSDPDGKYSAYLRNADGESQLMRSGDGIHFTEHGGDRVAEEITKVLLAKYRLE